MRYTVLLRDFSYQIPFFEFEQAPLLHLLHLLQIAGFYPICCKSSRGYPSIFTFLVWVDFGVGGGVKPQIDTGDASLKKSARTDHSSAMPALKAVKLIDTPWAMWNQW